MSVMVWLAMPIEKSQAATSLPGRRASSQPGSIKASTQPSRIAGSSSLPVKWRCGRATRSAAMSTVPSDGRLTPGACAEVTERAPSPSGCWPSTTWPVFVSTPSQRRYQWLASSGLCVVSRSSPPATRGAPLCPSGRWRGSPPPLALFRDQGRRNLGRLRAHQHGPSPSSAGASLAPWALLDDAVGAEPDLLAAAREALVEALRQLLEAQPRTLRIGVAADDANEPCPIGA